MKGKIELISAMLIFGSIGIFVRYIEMPSSVIALVRGVIGTCCLLLATLVLRRKLSREAIKRNLILLLISGTAIGVNWICLFEAYRYTTISVATLCYYLAPIFVMLLSPILLKEKLTIVKSMCILTALLGMVLVAGVFSENHTSGNQILGILFGVSAAAFYASVMIMNQFLKEISAIDSTTLQLGAASLVLLPYTLLTERGTVMEVSMKTMIILVLVGILHTGIAYLLYFSAMQKLDGQTVAIFSYIDPVTAILLSAILLGEHMSFVQITGAILILGSTCISENWKYPAKDR